MDHRVVETARVAAAVVRAEVAAAEAVALGAGWGLSAFSEVVDRVVDMGEAAAVGVVG